MRNRARWRPRPRKLKPAAAAHAAAAAPSAHGHLRRVRLGLVYKTLMSAFKLWKDTPEKIFGAPLKGGSISREISPELLGVGYIIGPRISSHHDGGRRAELSAC